MKYKILLFISLCVNALFLIKIALDKNVEFNRIDKNVAFNFERSALVHKEHAESTIRAIQPMLAKRPLMGRYLNPKFKLVVSKIDSCVVSLESYVIQNKKPDLNNSIERIKEINPYLINTFDSIAVFMSKYTKSVPKEIKIYTDNFKEKIKLDSKYSLTEKDKSTFLIFKEINRLRILENTFIESVCMLIPTHGTQISTRYYPFVIPECNRIKKSEKFKAEIWVSNFSLNQLYDYQLEINGKQYVLNENRVIFEEVANKMGENKLQINLKTHDPLTGERFMADTEFSYTVTE